MLDQIMAEGDRDIRPAEATLRAAHDSLKYTSPGIRAREAAAQLGVSEAELVAARVGDGVIRLTPDFGEVLKAMPEVGQVMALTRNDHCVHEKHGAFGNVSIGPGHGMVLNHDIDLRLFMSHWRFGFAVTEEVASGVRSSLQFFDIDGAAVHKIYVTNHSDRAAYDDIVARYGDPQQSGEISITPLPAKRAELPDSEIDIANFRAHWQSLQDTHDFFGLLQEFGVSRTQAMRLGGPEFVTPVAAGALRQVMEAASTRDIPIMCFVGSAGCIQIHTGPIKALKVMGPWFNILDPGFNLHLREDAIAAAYVVRKPTRDGDVTSLELFDASGHCFAQFFGERKPGKVELPAWRDAIAELTVAA